MIIRVTCAQSDTCGNSAQVGESMYMGAESLPDAWALLGHPRVVAYVRDGEEVRNVRTPPGKGYGHWEDNPDFDWSRDQHNATSVVVVGAMFLTYVNIALVGVSYPDEIIKEWL